MPPIADAGGAEAGEAGALVAMPADLGAYSDVRAQLIAVAPERPGAHFGVLVAPCHACGQAPNTHPVLDDLPLTSHMLVPVDDRGELEQRLVAIEKPEKEYPMHITVWQASRNRESKKQHVDRFRQWSSTIARDRKVVPERVEYETFCGTECRMTTPIILTAVHNRLRKVFEEVVNGLKVKISLVPRASVFLALELFYHAQDEEPVTSTLMFLLRTASGRSGHLVATQTFIKHVITERPDPTTYVGSILSPCELLHVEQPLCPEQFYCYPLGCYEIYTEDEVFDVVCAFFQGLIPKASTRIATITILELKHTRCFTERSGDVRRVTEHHHRCVLDVLHPNENRKPEKALLVDRCLPGLRLGPRDTNEVDPETTLTSDSTLGEMIATLLDDSEELKFYHDTRADCATGCRKAGRRRRPQGRVVQRIRS